MFWCFFFSLLIYFIHSLTHSSNWNLIEEKEEKNETDYLYNMNSSRRRRKRRRRRRKRPTGTTSLSMGKRLNKLLPLSDLINTYTYRSIHMRSVHICMYICASKRGIMIIVVGYQTYQLRLYGWVRVEKENKKKNCNILFVVGSKKKKREREREREAKEQWWSISSLFSSLPLL